MKLLKDLNTDLEAISEDSIAMATPSSSSKEILAIIALFAPVLIKIVEVWKLIPGKKKTERNKKLDKLIIALQLTSIFT